MEQTTTNKPLVQTVTPARTDRPGIFGLRYLEEEAAEIHDVIGCSTPTCSTMGGGSFTHNPFSNTCDDNDSD